MSIVIVLQQARNRRAPLSSTLRVEVAGWWWCVAATTLEVSVVSLTVLWASVSDEVCTAGACLPCCALGVLG